MTDGESCYQEHAPAKINLYLHVTGVRGDGYHTLDSLVSFVHVGDVVWVKPGTGLTLSLTGPYGDQVPRGADNLVLKAAELLARRRGIEPNAHITLEKNLPVASGIGGGSADAAAVLRALIRLWHLKIPHENIRHASQQIDDDYDTQLALETLFKVWRDDLDRDQMMDIALTLGADVPVCFEARTVFMNGIGEALTLAPKLPPVFMVLVNPNVTVSTPSVFQARIGEYTQAAPFFDAPKDGHDLARLLACRTNDLMAPAVSLAPVIQDVLMTLDHQDDCLMARMSGSGATCFGLFTNKDAADFAAHAIAKDHPDWWVVSTHLIDPIMTNY